VSLDPHFLSWPGTDDRVVVAEMLRDNFSEHWFECREFIRKQVLKRAGNIAQQDRDDVVQEIMGRVHLGLSTFHFGSRLTTWLMSIITHCIIDAYRKAKRTDQAPISSIFPGEPHETGEQEPAMQLASALEVEDVCIVHDQLEIGINALKAYIKTHAHRERNGKILDMVIVQGDSLEEAANAVGCSAAVAGYVVRQAQLYARQIRDQQR